MKPEAIAVPVEGGTLHVARFGPASGAPVAIAAHGVTANHTEWAPVVEHLGDAVTLLAPDLRGRGASATIAGPFGIGRHADDLIATLDHLGIERAVFVGHSMGGFVVTNAAVRYPDRVASLVIVDGGIKVLDPPPDADVDALLQQVIGPSLERLKTTFPSRAAYHEFWRKHPALAENWNPYVEAYFDYDLVGEEPALRSGVSLEAVYADSAGTLTDDLTTGAIERITQPAVFLKATRGVMNEEPGLYTLETVERVRERVPHMEIEIVDANHFMVVFGAGAPVVAERIRKACGA